MQRIGEQAARSGDEFRWTRKGATGFESPVKIQTVSADSEKSYLFLDTMWSTQMVNFKETLVIIIEIGVLAGNHYIETCCQSLLFDNVTTDCWSIIIVTAGKYVKKLMLSNVNFPFQIRMQLSNMHFDEICYLLGSCLTSLAIWRH